MWNLAGAITGVIAAGFFLLPHCGVRATIWIAAATNLAIGLAALLLDSKSAEAGDNVKDTVTPGEDRSKDFQQFGQARFWLFCAFISGFVTITMRRLVLHAGHDIGSSTYAFSIVLALFLSGLALGAYIVSTKKHS